MNLLWTCIALVAAALLGGSLPSLAQQPARMLSGYPPGGAVDVLARTFADEWSKAIGRPRSSRPNPAPVA